MRDKINRKLKPKASNATLKYGRGDVLLEANGEIAGVQIHYKGRFKGVKKIGKGWTIKANNKLIIIYSLAQSDFSELLFSYVADLKITSCQYCDWDGRLLHADTINENKDSWGINYGQWQSDARKYEEIEIEKIIKRKVKRTSI